MTEIVSAISKNADSATKLLELVYKDLAQPGVQNVGRALATVCDFINTLVLPIAFINSRASEVFKRNLEKYRERLDKVSPSDICEVPPEIGVPILEKLRYVTDDDISDLFVSLLSKASFRPTSHLAHPSFLLIVSALSPDEARMIKRINDGFNLEIPMLTGVLYNEDKQIAISVLEYLTLVDDDLSLSFPQNIPTYWVNLISHGLIECNRTDKLAGGDLLYEGLIRKSSRVAESKQIEESNGFKIVFRPGHLKKTDFGLLFISACVKNIPDVVAENARRKSS